MRTIRTNGKREDARVHTRTAESRLVKLADHRPAAMPYSFMLDAADARLAATGIARALPSGPADTLAARVRAFFAAHGDAALLVGAMPFDRNADDCLFEPQSVARGVRSPIKPLRPAQGGRWRGTPEPSRADYERAVARALEHIRGQAGAPLDKIVLSRSVRLEADAPIDVMALLARLSSDPAVVRFATRLGEGRHLVGATPELLVSKTGPAILSHPLAGSARRSDDPARDRAAADALLASEKDRREHRWVVEAILDTLSPYCESLAASLPALVSTGTMWHLGTRIEGTLRDPEAGSAAELAAALHPTPAVGGTPRDRALALIPQLEGYDRGFYAGAVGWTDRGGDGAWYVSLRCAEIAGRHARAYAGAGVVEGSVPASEADETSGKLQAMLRALGVDEEGCPLASEPAAVRAA